MRWMCWALTIGMSLGLWACGEADEGSAATPSDAGADAGADGAVAERRVAFEILQVVAADRIVTWLNAEMTQAEFEAIELPPGWFKNQPREGEPDGGHFARSPDAAADGEFVVEEHFGHTWTHVATVVETGVALDDGGLLRGTRVHKHHTVVFDAGRALSVIVSPDGVPYVRISRDAGRTRETPTMPPTWRQLEVPLAEPLTVQLPERTLVIRADNEDSFQGPVPQLDVGEAPPLPLSTELCADPAALQALGGPDAASGGDARFGEVDRATAQAMLEEPTAGPFYMVNLIRYRAQAQYADGRETDLTGREANALYAPLEFLSAIGARIVFSGEVGDVLIGQDGAWDEVSIVEYPCPLAFFAMTAHPGFQARAVHKDAGVEATVVMFTDLQPSPLPADFEPPESPFPATADDPAFEMIHVLRYREQAQYAADADEPPRTGREAMALYSNGAAEAAQRVGVYPTAWFTVRGVLIGDGRPWDEVRLNHMPSRAGFESLVQDPSRRDGQYHRDAALADTYSLLTYPRISAIPGAPAGEGGPGAAPPVTADGTGTICMTDDDCPGDGVATCLRGGDGAGFCTREGCGAGQCEAPYLCCRACSDAVAAFLPFDGSACLPAEQTAQLTAAPAECTCD